MPTGTKNKIIPGCGAHHISLRTTDLKASLHLYQETLGMETVAEFGPPERPMVLLDMGDGSHMELVGIKSETTDDSIDRDSNRPIQHFALATTDTKTAVERVRQAGYKVTVEPRDVNLNGLEVTIAFFEGPSGESIEFFQTH